LQDLRKRKNGTKEGFMRKKWLGLISLLTCTITLVADGYSASDQEFFAGKDFPFPPDESALPQNAPDDENMPSSGQSEKEIKPEVNSTKPREGKDIFPPDED
jgi:hypothetical protein